MPEPIRAVVAEDNYLVREGVRRLLEASGEVEVVAAVATADELLDAVRRLRPAAVVTDIRMPPDHHMEGVRAAHAIRAERPDVGVVVLSQHSDPAYALALLENGTAGLAYLLKDRVGDHEELLRAVREVVGGRSVIDPEVVAGLVARRARAAASPLRALTARELDVLRAMAEGRTNAGIADHLHLSESAIEKHINQILAKVRIGQEPRLHRRVAAVLAFLRETAGERAGP